MDHSVENESRLGYVGTEDSDESLTRVIGAEWDSDSAQFMVRNNTPDQFTVQLAPDDLLILASDGLTKSINSLNEQAALEQLEAVLKKCISEKLEARYIAQRLADAADNANSSDNITVHVIKIHKLVQNTERDASWQRK